MTQEYIATLIEKYLDGSTTGAEEQALREYFATTGDDIPAEWKPLRAMFAFVTAERTAAEKTSAAEETIQIKHPAAYKTHRIIMYACSAAAAILLLFGIVTHRHKAPRNYIVIDGVEYNDRDMAVREAEQTLEFMADTDGDPFDALEMMSR